jgi:DUF4097 and DUF4098 domain-containing protein YvlB
MIGLMTRTAAAAVVLIGLAPTAALAQRLPFERTLPVTTAVTVDVSTLRGKIDVSVGEAGRVQVGGAATVRMGWDVPSNAAQLAEQFAANPAIQQQGSTILLRPPADDVQRRAITVNYDVHVPPDTIVVTLSDSGATTIASVKGRVSVRTQSGAIDLRHLGGPTDVTTGSGAVDIDSVAAALTVATASSAITARALAGDVRLRTNSGAVNATVVGRGAVDVETGSSAITVEGAQTSVRTVTRSGRTKIRGVPGSGWDIITGSGAVDVAIETSQGFRVDATSSSGSVTVHGATVSGAVSKRKIAGTVHGDGPVVRIGTRSGAIALTVAETR